jgi:hypothetical protein
MLDLTYEEDVETAVEMVEQVLGKQGRMLPRSPTVIFNVKITGPKNTVLWYGDIDTAEDNPKISALANRFGFGLIAHTETGQDQLYPALVGIQL